ncbi:ryncolin-1-like isoform X2 [Haematobia irritans]|uniref:ryncolin-1-like isoform X2 n=1 Tax=Haematobia irritans TaxID=7368 RepID=UPI003F50560D
MGMKGCHKDCDASLCLLKDLSDGTDHVFIVQQIFHQLHNLVEETNKLQSKFVALNERFTELYARINETSVDVFKFKIDISTAVDHHKDEIQTDLNKRFERMNSQFNNEIKAFKTDISKALEGQKTSLDKIVNESEKYHKRQDEQIKALWDNGSMENKSNWTIILRRLDGSIDFNRTWNEYKHGFGNTNSEFFLGLEVLHKITSNGTAHELFIRLKFSDNLERYARYDNIVIGSEEEGYILKELGAFSGQVEDSLRHHVGEKFTTKDRDNDNANNGNCAQLYGGPWWFYQCSPSSQLFGPYNWKSRDHGMRWGLHRIYGLKFVEIKLREL